jgi:hypothetical protein
VIPCASLCLLRTYTWEKDGAAACTNPCKCDASEHLGQVSSSLFCWMMGPANLHHCAAFSGSVAVAVSPSSRRRRPQASQWRFLTCARNHRRWLRTLRFGFFIYIYAPSSSDRQATHTGWMHELRCCLSPRHSAPPWLHAYSASGKQCHPHHTQTLTCT